MAELATTLLRTVARAFYTVEHVLVLDALIFHSTLQDTDLASLLGMQPKSLRKLCGRLREDGLVSVQTRAERRVDGIPSFYSQGPDGKQKGERLQSRDWYYLNYHRAIDYIKYRVHKLSRWVDSLGAPTTEKMDFRCPRCKAEYTNLEAMDRFDHSTGDFLCHRCGHSLDQVEEEEKSNENEMKKRLNLQMSKVIALLRQIDETIVPENTFEEALAKHIPVNRGVDNPGAKREIVDLPNRNMQSTRGLELQPERVAVNLQDEESAKRESESEEARLRREREARQNALPEWIAKSTVSGDVTSVGAKEERLRREREALVGGDAVKAEASSEDKKAAAGDDDVMAAYWEELARQQREAAAKAEEEDEEEEDDEEDDFEDVAGVGANGNATPGVGSSATPYMMSGANGTGASTPAQGAESSNATDDERDAKRVRLDPPQPSASAPPTVNGIAGKVAEDTPAASDEDEDDLEFENV